MTMNMINDALAMSAYLETQVCQTMYTVLNDLKYTPMYIPFYSK